MYAFGVDVGGTTVKLGFFRTDGTLFDKWEIRTRTEDGGKNIIPDIAAAVLGRLRDNNISANAVVGIGIGVPGPVTDDGIVNKCINLGWGVTPVEKELSKLTGFKVRAANDANIAALGEMWQGGGRGYNSPALLTLGTGVGGGIVINGHILSGTNGAAGEVGHIHVDDSETEMCTCGNYGCLEQYASATGIVRIARRAMAAGGATAAAEPGRGKLLLPADFTAKDIFDAAKAGDSFALSVVDKFANVLGKGCAAVASSVDPDVFIIGGGVSKAGSIIIDKVQSEYKKYAFHASKGTPFKLAELGNDAGIYGGVKLVLD
ncbi:MAG: ROK family glucokinase [Eubacteriales bacterium]|nr:ROK family glucokinase [Eubacteriales bacterium]